MTKIIVFNRYAADCKNILGFSKSFGEILINSLVDIGFNVEYVSDTTAIKNVKDSLVLSIISPTAMMGVHNEIHKSNRHIWWNIEPISIQNNEKDTEILKTRRLVCDSIISDICGHGIHKVLLFDKNQVDLYRNNNVHFLPIGFHECLLGHDKTLTYGVKKTKYALVGDLSLYRRSFLSRAMVHLPREVYEIQSFGHRCFRGLEHEKRVLFYFRFGLDIPACFKQQHIHWHRFMVYAARQMVLISSSDLSDYGFVDTVHYFHYKSLCHFVDIIKHLHTVSKYDTEIIANNMLTKMKNDFYMPNLLNEVLGDIK